MAAWSGFRKNVLDLNILQNSLTGYVETVIVNKKNKENVCNNCMYCKYKFFNYLFAMTFSTYPVSGFWSISESDTFLVKPLQAAITHQ